jgi:hypothetical protein
MTAFHRRLDLSNKESAPALVNVFSEKKASAAEERP